MTIMQEREQEMARFQVTVKREFPGVTFEAAKNVTRGGRVSLSSDRLVCDCKDQATRDRVQMRFCQRNHAVNDTTLVFQF